MEVNAENRENVGKGRIRKQNSLPLGEKKNTILFGVRNSVKLFVGRDKQLDNLHKILQNETIVVISGIDGIGKSELAKKYISEYRGNYDNRIVWINAESHQAIGQSFRTLAADELQISTKNADDDKNKDIISVVEDVYKYFSDKKSLFVFDNVKKYKSSNEFDDGINKYIHFAPDVHKPHIIIISHNQQWPKNIRVLHLNEFTMGESMEFIKKSLGTENNLQETDVKRLARKLQCIPFALQQAVVCISIQTKQLKHTALKFDINDYIEMYEKNIAIIDYDSLDFSDRHYYKIIFTAWNITWQTIKQNKNGNAALEILNIISYLAPDNIPIEFFFYLKNNEGKFTSAFELLKQYLIINIEQDMINIHQFVQQAVRLKLRREERYREYIMKAVKLFETKKLRNYNINHAIHIWNCSYKHADLLEKTLSLAIAIICTLIDSGTTDEGQSFGSSVIKLLKSHSLKNREIRDDFVATKRNVAKELMRLDKLDEALELLNEILSVQKSICPFKAAYVKTRTQMALIMHYQRNYEDSLTFNNRLIRMCRHNLGEEQTDTLITKHAIAKVLLRQNKHDEAMPILQQVYKDQSKILGENHRDTLKTEDTIMREMCSYENYCGGFRKYKEIYNADGVTLSIFDPDLINSKMNMAQSLSAQGQWSMALKMFRQIHSMQIAFKLENDSDVLFTICQTGETYRFLGDYDEAFKTYHYYYEVSNYMSGSHHFAVLNLQQGVADVYSDMGKYKEALHEYQDVLTKRKTIDGDNHPKTLKVMTSIAEVYSKQKKYDMASKYWEKILKIQKKILHKNHVDIITTKNSLAMALRNNKQYNKASNIIGKALETMQKFYPDHPDNLVIKTSKALILRDQKQYVDAKKILNEVLDEQINILGSSHPNVEITKANIGSVLAAERIYPTDLKLHREKSFCEKLFVQLCSSKSGICWTGAERRGVIELMYICGDDGNTRYKYHKNN